VKLTVQVPIFGTISPFNSRTIGSVKLTVQVPNFGTISPFNSRTIGSVTLTVQVPNFGTISINLADWFLTLLTFAFH
jgi:hypothetical protein